MLLLPIIMFVKLGVTDRSYVLHDGKILIHGTTDKIIKDPMVRRVYLGENFKM